VAPCVKEFELEAPGAEEMLDRRKLQQTIKDIFVSTLGCGA